MGRRIKVMYSTCTHRVAGKEEFTRKQIKFIYVCTFGVKAFLKLKKELRGFIKISR